MTKGNFELADIRTGKGPDHQEAAKKKAIKTNLSNAEIVPANDLNKAMPLLQETRKILQSLNSKGVSSEVQEKWTDRAIELGIGKIIKSVESNNYTDADLETLELFIAEAEKGLSEVKVEKRTRAKSEKEMETQYLRETLNPYQRNARETLLRLGTDVNSEWEVTGYNDLGEKARGACHLCGHAPIRYEYIITKMRGKNKGIELKIGSECVVNYLGIPLGDVKEFARKFEFEKQSDPENVKVQLETLLDRIDRMTDLPTAREHGQWEYYHKWKGKDQTVKKSIEMLENKGRITDARLKKMLGMLKDVLQDEKLIEERVEEDIKAKQEELKSDPLYEIMRESIEFHDQNSFLKDIYGKWVKRYRLTDKQVNAFKGALNKMKKQAKYGESTFKEHDGLNTVKGTITALEVVSILGRKGTFEKITFDLVTTLGVITDISTVEWDTLNFVQIQELNDGEDHVVTIQYELKDGRWRNLSNVIETDAVYAPPIMSVPDPDLDISVFRGLVPRNWQSAHFMPWWNARRGIVQAGTGAGKTKFAIMAILMMLDENPNAKIVIAVPTMELQKQWKRELKAYSIKVTLIGGGHGKEFGQITIGIYNSLWEMEIEADLLIGDEAHHLSSNTDMNVSIWRDNLHTIDRILFLTATPGRYLIEDMPVIAVVSQEELQEEGSLAYYTVTNLRVDMDDTDRNIYDQITAQIAVNTEEFGEDHLFTKIVKGERYRWVTNHPDKMEGTALLVKNLVSQGKKIILFTTKIETMYVIEEAMSSYGVPISIVHSSNPEYKMPAKVRAQNFADFADGITNVLVGAFAISEGVDVPEADVAIIMGGTSQEREFIQRSGRVLRVTPDKTEAEIFQVYMEDTMEAGWVKSRLKSIPRNTTISDHEMKEYLNQ
ncbi:DEAD/DEAH box helicase family protein [Candidatus Dependentiae bacterium]|nr:DEAD/DEAH box helicase family protein [Candidatus Dependentiae bacterium]